MDGINIYGTGPFSVENKYRNKNISTVTGCTLTCLGIFTAAVLGRGIRQIAAFAIFGGIITKITNSIVSPSEEEIRSHIKLTKDRYKKLKKECIDDVNLMDFEYQCAAIADNARTLIKNKNCSREELFKCANWIFKNKDTFEADSTSFTPTGIAIAMILGAPVMGAGGDANGYALSTDAPQHIDIELQNFANIAARFNLSPNSIKLNANTLHNTMVKKERKESI